MNITEIRVKMVGSGNNEERLRAFCSITLDGAFVIRDLKVIDGANGPFVAMPSRKLTDRCPKCGCKNHLRAKYCNECGGKLDAVRAPRDGEGRVKLHADVAHPINAAGREQIQREVLIAFERELDAASRPGYQAASLEVDEFGDDVEYDDFLSEIRESVSQRNDRRVTAAAPVERGPSPRPDRGPQPRREQHSGGKRPAAPPPRRDEERRADRGPQRERGATSTTTAPPPPPAQDDPFSAGIF